MSRTTEQNVKTVIETALETEDIQRLMAMANRMITNSLGSSGLDEALLTDIETWMTAHLIAVGKERQIASEKVHDVWITYQGKFGDFLRSTTYGQMVLSLDTTGTMDQATRKKAWIKAVPQDSDNE